MQNLPAWLDRKASVILDLDGVVYEGAEAIPGAVSTIAALRACGKRVVFLTNNSARNPSFILNKLGKMGIAVEREELVTSGVAAVWWLKEQDAPRVYVSGTDELAGMFLDAGFDVRSNSAEADAIVVGMDPEFSYKKIAAALPGLLRGAKLVACNRDAFYPSGAGAYSPGCGAMIAALEGACARAADVVVGKPNPKMLEIICDRFGFAAEQTVMVGDTFTSDIVMAREFGMDSVWITAAETVRDGFAGTYRLPSLGHLPV